MLLTLSGENAPDELAEMVLRRRGGRRVLVYTAGGPPVSAIVPRGKYVLELRHALAGNSDAPTRVVFLQPHPSDAAATATALAAVADVAQTDSTGMPAMTLTASRDCIQCNFANAALLDQNFDGVTLTNSNFDGTRMSKTSFRGAIMPDCTLYDVVPDLSRRVPFDADFTGATLSRSFLSFQVIQGFAFDGVFRDAHLDETVWESPNADEFSCKLSSSMRCSYLNPDFRNADLRLARFRAIRFVPDFGRGLPYACTFQGADLAHASFQPSFPRKAIDLSWCRFDREPESGRVTSFRGTGLYQARARPFSGLYSADFSDADFTDAIFSNADFGTTSVDAFSGRGAVMRRANFTGATLAGARFARADLRDAIFAGLTAFTFQQVDLRSANLAGAKFAGSNLSRVNLGQALPFSAGVPEFKGAVLTDGTRGVDLTGQIFPNLFTGFKGLDLTGAILTRVELSEADLERTTLNRAQMVGANLSFSSLKNANLRGATLGAEPGHEKDAAKLRGALLTGADFSDADLRSVNLTGAHLYRAERETLLVRVKLDSAKLNDAICTGTHFSGSLNNATFHGADLVNSVFNGATLTNTSFDDAYLQGADFSAAISATGASLANAAVAAAPGNWTFREQDGTPFTYRYDATKLGPLALERSVICPNGNSGPCCESGDLAQCLTQKLKPKSNGPYPPIPKCVRMPPKFDNCYTPLPTATRAPTRTATPNPQTPTITP